MIELFADMAFLALGALAVLLFAALVEWFMLWKKGKKDD